MRVILIIIVALQMIGLFSACSKDDLVDKPLIVLRPAPSPIPLYTTSGAVFYKDIAYDDFSLTTFDLFVPGSNLSAPLVIFIHGGSFSAGDKTDAYANPKLINQINYLLSQGIAFANINYRLINTGNDEQGFLKPLGDGKRCLQFIRYYANELGIDKYRIALEGHSAGAGTAMWIAFSDNLAEATANDPVFQESTGVLGVAAFETQATYDLFRWEYDVFNEYGLLLDKSKWPNYYGVKTAFELYFSPAVYEYRLQVDILNLMESSDPELWLCNSNYDYSYPATADHINHHPLHAKLLKDHADAIGLQNTTYIPKMGIMDPGAEDVNEFFIRKLLN